MNRGIALLILLLAAILEAAGDAIMRKALHSPNVRFPLLLAGGVVLTAYGWVVNAPPWDFGRLLGLYVVFFFVVAQIISWLVFHQPPTVAVLGGGILILAGGAVIALNS